VTASPTLARCPVCAANVPLAPRCELCLVPMRVERGALVAVHPLIRPGDVLVSRDFSREPLPAEKHRAWSRLDGIAATEDPSGIVVHLPPGEARVFMEDWVRLRDGCVRAAFACLDGRAQVGVMFRREPIGDGARTFYSLDVWPDRRSVQLARCFSTKTDYGAAPLLAWKEVPAVLPGNGLNEVELRAQGTAIEAWVNGACVAQVHDMVLGIGWTGIRAVPVGAPPQSRTRVLCRGFEVRAVAL
jgi:hypothetical protein